MLRTVYEALTSPTRFLGFLGDGGLVEQDREGIFVSSASKDQIQAYLRDLLETGMYYGAQESIGAMQALAAREEREMKQADYGPSYSEDAHWEGRYAALQTDIEAVKDSLKEYLAEGDQEEKELAEVVLEWLGEVGR